MSATWSIAYGREAEHAAALKRGLATLPSNFVAEICWLCGGRGEREQTFTNGCGMGYSRMRSGCDYCDGTGLLQGDKAAPVSVREQVLNAEAPSKLAPGHTDLMVSPESIDAFMERNPLPESDDLDRERS